MTHVLIDRATLQAVGAQMKWAVPHLPVHTDEYFESMAAISAALDTPCEPQLIKYRHKNGDAWFQQYGKDPLPEWAVDVQPAQPAAQPQPLTGEAIERILIAQPNGEHMNLLWFYNAVRAVEAAHHIFEKKHDHH